MRTDFNHQQTFNLYVSRVYGKAHKYTTVFNMWTEEFSTPTRDDADIELLQHLRRNNPLLDVLSNDMIHIAELTSEPEWYNDHLCCAEVLTFVANSPLCMTPQFCTPAKVSTLRSDRIKTYLCMHKDSPLMKLKSRIVPCNDVIPGITVSRCNDIPDTLVYRLIPSETITGRIRELQQGLLQWEF